MQAAKRAGATRRELLQTGAVALLVLPVVAACGSGSETSDGSSTPQPPAPPAPPELPPAPIPEPPVPEPPAAGGGGGEGQLVTEVAASAALVSALQYVHESPNAEERCDNCQLYTAQGDGLGKCQLFATGGLVKEAGWCASWAAKVS
jgi:hypothetical protein